MIEKILRTAVVAIAICISGSFSATAQDFCNLEGTELLEALDGNWSVKQGAGGAQGGGMAMPLKPKRAVTMDFRYLSAEGASLISGKDIPKNTFLTQALAGEYDIALDMVKAANKKIAPGACPAGKAPLLIASNVGSSSHGEKFHGKLTTRTCFALGVLGKGVVKFMTNSSILLANNIVKTTHSCAKIDAAKGTVATTMIMRFSSSDAGSGVVLFQGSAKGSGQNVSFIGAAPITLKRK